VLYRRLRSGVRTAISLSLGLLAVGVAVAVPVYHSVTERPEGDDYSGFVALMGGTLLVGVAAHSLWSTRRTDERWVRRFARRALTGAGAAVVVFWVLVPVGFAFVITHQPRSSVSTADLGAVHEEVRMTTSDGLTLAGWYVASRNGTAVIVFPGRSGPLDHARMLVRHGYGVLLLDRRGTGESEGDGIVTGWNGDKDILAAIDFLAARPDVREGRIGGLGLSVGGEILLQTAARSGALRAVVTEGAGARSIRDQRHDVRGAAWALLPQDALFTAATMVFAGQAPRLTWAISSARSRVRSSSSTRRTGREGRGSTPRTTRRRGGRRRSGRSPTPATPTGCGPTRRSTRGGWSPSSTPLSWETPREVRHAAGSRLRRVGGRTHLPRVVAARSPTSATGASPASASRQRRSGTMLRRRVAERTSCHPSSEGKIIRRRVNRGSS
jgi:hypothetical protein